MSKLETVKALNDTQPHFQIVQAVMNLEMQAEALRSMLDSLPQAVAEQTAEALEPLEKLRAEVSHVLSEYEQVTIAPRQTLEELTQQMSTSAAAAFAEKSKQMEVNLADLSRRLSSLTTSIESMAQTARNLETIPAQLKQSAQDLTTTAHELMKVVKSTRPKRWQQALGLILASTIGAMLVATGQVALERLLPPSAVQQNAAWAARVWANATPKDQALIQQIVNRHEN